MVSHLSNKLIALLSATLFLCGLLLTFQWHEYSQKRSITELETSFNDYAVKASVSLQQALVRENERLASLAAAFKLTDSMSHQEFSRFAQVVSLSTEHIQSLQWIKVIDKAQQQTLIDDMVQQGFSRFEIKNALNNQTQNQANTINQMAVIKYIYPLLINENKIGLDIYSDDASREAAFIADITQSPISVVPNTESPLQQHQSVVTIYQPIYGHKGELRGFVASTLAMHSFIDFVVNKNLLEKSLRWFIEDNYSKKTLYGEKPSIAVNGSDLVRYSEFFLPFSGRSWSLKISANLSELPEYNQKRFEDAYSSWGLGIVSSAILSLLLYLLLKLRFNAYQAEKTILDNEKKYQQLIKQSSEGFLLLNREGYILDVNSEICHMLGYSKEELLKKHLSDIDSENDFFQAKRLCFSIMPKDKLLYETTFQKQRGTRITVEVSASRIMMSGKEVIGAFIRDLTERLTYRALSLDNKQLQDALQHHTQELQAQKNTFEALFEKSSDGIFIFDGKRLLDCNQAALDMFAFYDKASFFASNPYKLMPKFQPDGERSMKKAIRMMEICALQGRHRFEWLYKRSSGEDFWCDVVLTQIEYFSKPVIHLAMRDITLRKRLEIQMESARAEAVYANQVKSEFLAKMSHEIRTPLHGILNYSRMGEERIHSVDLNKLQRYFNHIKISAERLLVLFNDLLDSAKLDHGSMSYDFKYQNLQPVVENCLVEQQVAIKNRQINVELRQLDYMAYFDKYRIAQVVSNLLSNAIRYTPEGQTIVIQVESQQQNQIVVSIRDSGIGVEPEKMESIFENFVSNRNEAMNVTGSGLGLAICHEIIKAHRGLIWVENWVVENQVQGAIFKFTLPLSMNYPASPLNSLNQQSRV